MRLFLIIVSLAFSSGGPAYNYRPQHLNTNIIGANNQEGHQFLQEALQGSRSFLGHNLQQQSTNYNGQFFASPNKASQQQHFNYQPIHPIVSKDIYVHVPPEDPEDNYEAPPAPILPPRKHYRIVFIKAPVQKINKASLRITHAPTEEKTIIYVLSKKQDPLELEAVLNNVQPNQPSKPEVFFIKYKTQEEAAHAQQSIQAQYDMLGGTSEFSDEGIAPVTSVIGSLQHHKQLVPQSEAQLESSIESLSHSHGHINEETLPYLPPNH